MYKHISIQWKMTIVSALVIALTCIGLTTAVNISAFHMADIIDSQVGTPAKGSSQLELQPMVPALTTQELWDTKLSFGQKSIGHMVFAILLGSALTYYATGKVLAPLKSLTEDVRNTTIENLSKPIHASGSSSEIMALSASFNDMTNRLHEAYTLQKRFSVDAAHELRTPLAVLQAKVDVFQKEPCHTQAEYDLLIETLQRHILRLKNLSQSLLEMTAVEDRSQWAEFELGELLTDVAAELEPIALKKHIQILLNCEDCVVNGNVDQLYRVFFNLIENGIKYNQENGTVTVTARKTQTNRTQVVLSDTGIGIPDDMKPHIFEPFYRVDKSRSRQMGGAGLGLAMVESIIKQHNGTIGVSDSPTGGTCFTLELGSVTAI